MKFNYLHPKEKVAEVLRRIYSFGMTTTSGGNVSMKDEEGNIWITPSAVIGGTSLHQAYARFETLEFCAKTETQAMANGQANSLKDPQIDSFHNRKGHEWPEFDHQNILQKELDVRAELIRVIKRAYQQRLIISTFGTFSARLGDDAFIITPTGRDRYYMRRQDLVLIKNGSDHRIKEGV